ncbi:hypothetical protein HUT19_28985 [Streptomyces sp. NA02950]|uniref:hypothetical protein n=1 Tax=Streptomyces sp. NA02950 TaxID=2742137 RepID=UPI0015918B98|nr:hypothetical protein [Streptomyces sp. NA02950]QKV95270.1 hypothetical protein HUT19_28985 [Streptomyces sp. NA02950]
MDTTITQWVTSDIVTAVVAAFVALLLVVFAALFLRRRHRPPAASSSTSPDCNQTPGENEEESVRRARVVRARRTADRLTYAIATMASGASLVGMWPVTQTAVASAGVPECVAVPVTLLTLGFIEGAIVACGIRARANILDGGTGGADATLMWTAVAASSLVSALEAAVGAPAGQSGWQTLVVVFIRLLAPAFAGLLWERGLAPERRAHTDNSDRRLGATAVHVARARTRSSRPLAWLAKTRARRALVAAARHGAFNHDGRPLSLAEHIGLYSAVPALMEQEPRVPHHLFDHASRDPDSGVHGDERAADRTVNGDGGADETTFHARRDETVNRSSAGRSQPPMNSGNDQAVNGGDSDATGPVNGDGKSTIPQITPFRVPVNAAAGMAVNGGRIEAVNGTQGSTNDTDVKPRNDTAHGSNAPVHEGRDQYMNGRRKDHERPSANSVGEPRRTAVHAGVPDTAARRQRTDAARAWHAAKKADPTLSQRAFAKSISRSPGWLSKAINEVTDN